MGRDLADGNLAVPRHQPGADLNGGDCKSPSWADAIRPDPLDGRSGSTRTVCRWPLFYSWSMMLSTR